ncbi:MAG: hypothetical protein AAF569_08145 [Pseudomonadota bacterium]
MRILLKELMDKLGVGYVLSPYENSLWSVYDDEQSMTCSAEVRMGPDGDELEAELQVLYDDIPPEGKEPLEQVFSAFFKPAVGSKEKWESTYIKIKGKGNDEDVYEWEEKACRFFDACVQELKMGVMPDIEAILEKIMSEKERFSDQYGGGGSKAPKIQANQLLGMKHGRGM